MTNHPAKYNKPILDVISQVIKNNYPTQPISILDCFGGVGGIHDLSSDTWGTYAIEIEREWADVSREKGWTDWGDFFDFKPYTAWFRQDEHKYAPSPTMFDVVAVSTTYGNRMADHHEAKDYSKRMTYRHQLGRPLTENNSGGMQWGPDYRTFHEAAWTKVRTLLEYGGLLILNVKDHVRKGEVIKVCDWHKDFITHEVGMTCIDDIKVPVNGMGFGANGKSRVDHERVIVFLK